MVTSMFGLGLPGKQLDVLSFCHIVVYSHSTLYTLCSGERCSLQ